MSTDDITAQVNALKTSAGIIRALIKAHQARVLDITAQLDALVEVGSGEDIGRVAMLLADEVDRMRKATVLLMANDVQRDTLMLGSDPRNEGPIWDGRVGGWDGRQRDGSPLAAWRNMRKAVEE